jgi:hypothetical protein
MGYISTVISIFTSMYMILLFSYIGLIWEYY